MKFHHLSASVLLVAALLAPACKTKNADSVSTGSGSATAASGSASGSAVGSATGAAPDNGSAMDSADTAAVGSATPIGTGDPATTDQLAAIKLPTPPHGAPVGGSWQEVPREHDGQFESNFKNGDAYIFHIRLIDCRWPAYKAYESKAPDDRGVIGFCYDSTTEKLKGYPLFTTNASMHAVKAGNIVIMATPVDKKLTMADADATLESLDLAAIAKM